MTKIGDSYTYSTNETTNTIRNTACFSFFNCALAGKKAKEAIIFLEPNKLEQLGRKEATYFLNNIKKIGVIDFKLKRTRGEYSLIFNPEDEKTKKKSYYQYTGMLVRCLYKGYDDFVDIAKNFIKMCKYFPKMDKGILFTVACNIYCTKGDPNKPYGYNSNHILMYNTGCKILDTKQIIELLDKNTGINENFSKPQKLDNYLLADDSKESYLKIFELNGIKQAEG